jgi:DNA-directed RNA polymerase sigma subunit (sigma70/sigma32)
VSDYRLSMKVRNANLLRRIEQAGYKSGGKFAQAAGLVAAEYYQLVSLKLSPMNNEGEWRPCVLRLAEFLKCSPMDLFSVEQYVALEKNTAEVDLSSDDIQSILYSRNQAPELGLERGEVLNAIGAALDRLDTRHANVLRLRFGIDCEPRTLDQIAESLGVCRERVRQMEAKGLRKMIRSSGHRDQLRDALDTVSESGL